MESKHNRSASHGTQWIAPCDEPLKAPHSFPACNMCNSQQEAWQILATAATNHQQLANSNWHSRVRIPVYPLPKLIGGSNDQKSERPILEVTERHRCTLSAETWS